MNVLLSLLLATLLVAPAESPFAGTWKLNPAKSTFVGTTVSFMKLSSGAIRHTERGQSYEFRTDEREVPALFGMTATWKQLDSTTFQAAYKTNGRVLMTNTSRISGGTMTVTSEGTLPDGKAFHDTTMYQRLSGGPGMLGNWKSTRVTISSPEVMVIRDIAEGLSWSFPAAQLTADTKFDGSETRISGPATPPNVTVAVEKLDARSLRLLFRQDGKIFSRDTYTVSTDGRTLTVVSAAEGTAEQVTAVYDRQ